MPSTDARKSSKSLIVTEKPSVARDLVAALGGFRACDRGDYWESDHYLCTFAVGHILELQSPEDVDPVYKRWRLADLPILPREFKYKPIDTHKGRLKVIRQLMMREDVNCLINACDAAREGELIFRELVHYIGCRKWVRRLWLQSMTPEAIRKGFDCLRDGVDLDGLGAAAECRARADWLIGMNATRAFSIKLKRREDRHPWSVGRVQTPTLALLVERELAILEHVPADYWQVVADFGASDHTYEGRWFDPAWRENSATPEARDDRIFDRAAAERIVAAVQGQPGLASETRDQSRRAAPPLFHLTALQKHMSIRYKWTAKRTLEAAQRCYEQHKVLTYPRTNSACLPSDYRGEVTRLIDGLATAPEYQEHARYLQKHGLENAGRIFNDSGVDDHFAIIPTGRRAALGGDDARVYDAVVRRFLAAFHPPAVYDRVRRETVAAGMHFRTGPLETLVVAGWQGVWDREADPDRQPPLPPLVAGQARAAGVPVKNHSAKVKTSRTQPPPRLTEAALLGLMENAGRRLDDDQLAAALMSAEGLGTAATRADIIQNLKLKQYVDQSLRPTLKGIRLIETLRRLSSHRLVSPELTARLELQLAEVERRVCPPEQFMSEIVQYVRDVTEAARALEPDQAYRVDSPVGTCPGCGKGAVRETPDGFRCEGGERPCGFALPRLVDGRYLDRVHAAQLLATGTSGPMGGFRAGAKETERTLSLRNGRLLIDGTEAPVQVQRPSADDAGARDGPLETGRAPAPAREVVCPCPVHPDTGCQVVATARAYLCETRLRHLREGRPTPVGLYLPKELCGRPFSKEEAAGFAAAKGSGGEVAGFVSKSGKPFSAALVMAEDGRFNFQFNSAKISAPLVRQGAATASPGQVGASWGGAPASGNRRRRPRLGRRYSAKSPRS